jgi:hypothetical protein
VELAERARLWDFGAFDLSETPFWRLKFVPEMEPGKSGIAISVATEWRNHHLLKARSSSELFVIL